MKKMALAVIALLLVFVFSSGICFASSEAIGPFNGITWDAVLQDMASIGIKQGVINDGYIMCFNNDVKTNVAGFEGLGVYYFTEDATALEKIDIFISTGVDERGDNIVYIFNAIIEYLESYYNVKADVSYQLFSADGLKYINSDDATIGKAINNGELKCEGTLQTSSSDIRLYSFNNTDAPQAGLCLNYVRADNASSEEMETKADLTTSNVSTAIAPFTTVTWDATYQDMKDLNMEATDKGNGRMLFSPKGLGTVTDIGGCNFTVMYTFQDGKLANFGGTCIVGTDNNIECFNDVATYLEQYYGETFAYTADWADAAAEFNYDGKPNSNAISKEQLVYKGTMITSNAIIRLTDSVVSISYKGQCGLTLSISPR